MADHRVPEEVIQWMQVRDWGNHHDMWHTVRRWDIYGELAAQGVSWATQVVNYIQANGWTRSSLQEGVEGNGLEFIAMHRAMLQLLSAAFPQHAEYFRGWSTPPRDPADPSDPVPDGSSFDETKAVAIRRIEEEPGSFSSEDDFGRYIQTVLRPTTGDPFARTDDETAGIHNYLHNRWTDATSEINLGDPRVNLFNARFWSLHGWIDRMWGRFREHHGVSDRDPEYVALIEHHRAHMGMPPHHPIAPALELKAGRIAATRPEALRTVAFLEKFD